MEQSTLIGRVYQAEDIYLSNDDLQNPLGGGGFGVVVRAFTTKLGVVAVKRLEFKAAGVKPIEDLIQEMPDEVKNMHLLNHDNILRMHGFTVWQGYLGIILDYMPVGNLDNFLDKVTPSLSMRLKFALDVSNALCYLHAFEKDTRIVHGDIKPQNVLLDDRLRAKLIDFGTFQIAAYTSAQSRLSTDQNKTNNAHSINYCSPEYLKKPFGRRSTPQDIYSYGMFLYHLLSCKVPFSEHQNDEFIKGAIIGGQRPILNPENILQGSKTGEKKLYYCMHKVMKQCWDQTPDKRPKISQVREQLQEAFFADNHDRNLGLELAEDALHLLKKLNIKLEPIELKKERTLKDFKKEYIKTPAASSIVENAATSSVELKNTGSTMSYVYNDSETTPKSVSQSENVMSVKNSSLGKVGDPAYPEKVKVSRKVSFVSPSTVDREDDKVQQEKTMIRMKSAPKSPDRSHFNPEGFLKSPVSTKQSDAHQNSKSTLHTSAEISKDKGPYPQDFGSTFVSFTDTETGSADHTFGIGSNSFLLDDASVCIKNERYAEAIELLQKYTVEKGNAMDQFNLDMKLAFCYFKEIQREKGNRIFEAAFKKMDQTEPSKKRAGGLFEIAELYRQNGLESRAMFLYSSVARMFCDSKQEVSATNVAVINKCLNGMMQNDEQLKDGTPGKEKNIEIFRGILQKISELKDKHPNMPEAISLGFYYLARCYSQRGDGKKSSHYNKRAVQVMQSAHPDSYKNFYMVGYCMHNLAANQEKIGLHHEAMQYFQKAIEYLEVATDWNSNEDKEREISHTHGCLESLRRKMRNIA